MTHRPITGFHQDEVGDWVAELGCGHNQHVRHRPPFQPRDWVLDVPGRRGRMGQPLDCPLCDRAEMPDAVRLARTTATWDEHTVPAGLRRAHRVAPGTWGRVVVESGRLRFRASTDPPIDRELAAGQTQAIPPEIRHEVEPVGAVRFFVQFLTVDRDIDDRRGGDPACWAGLLCPECGSVMSDGYHRPGCSGLDH